MVAWVIHYVLCEDLTSFIFLVCCIVGPILIRLAWHDSGTFDASIKADWPKAGGATGTFDRYSDLIIDQE